jgi:hypothetical protein
VAEAFADHIHQPVTRAGDVIIFSEATVHGATPWRGKHQRRVAIYRFSPANLGYGRGYLEVEPAMLSGMTPLQRAVLEPPYAIRLDRPLVPEVPVDGSEPEIKTRSGTKKQFDRELFGTSYF